MKKLLACTFIVFALYSPGQVAPGKYFIRFTDKNNNPYSLGNPSAFLTQRAIERRQKQGIGYEENDLPVTPSYIQQVRELGAIILNPTKWLNGVTVKVTDTNILGSIRNLPFVESVSKPFHGGPVAEDVPDKFSQEKISQTVNPSPGFPENSQTYYNYGESYTQIHQVNGDAMHDAGYRGNGIVIAQLDAGYYHADRLPAFDSLWQNHQILGTKDFLHNGKSFFNDSTVIHDSLHGDRLVIDIHGMYVLSILAGNLPGHLIGSAPRAKYWLLRTEEIYYEYRCEEYNWISGAEFADSVGADIITSSLGYTTFDSAFQSHTCAEMDGHTAPSSIGANIAFSKGIVVVVSAGNSGTSWWKCVSAPSDADYAMSIAAVDANGFRAGFSSLGVDTNGRIKPNVAAMGAGTFVQDRSGGVTSGSGTSFSAPVIAGMTACLLQACPGSSNIQVKQAIEYSGNQAAHPDSLLGYGIPDFNKARLHMGMSPGQDVRNITVIPNPFTTSFHLKFYLSENARLNVSFFNTVGRKVFERDVIARAGENSVQIRIPENLQAGIYFMKMEGGNVAASAKLIRIP